MLETIVGVAVGASIVPVYDHFIRPYVMLKHSGVSFFKANKKHAADLGHAVAEWDDLYKIKSLGMPAKTKNRDKLPENVRESFTETLNTSRMRETANAIVERYRIKKAAGYNFVDMYLERLARKNMIKSFYQEPAVLAYLTSN